MLIVCAGFGLVLINALDTPTLTILSGASAYFVNEANLFDPLPERAINAGSEGPWRARARGEAPTARGWERAAGLRRADKPGAPRTAVRSLGSEG